jgi:pyruvate dehydrogenase E2 component (dihydrolipoamide acetyltransferase)
MEIEVIMPKLGLTMQEGTVTAWFKQEGEKVTKGEAIAEVGSEKITNVVEAPADGILKKIVAGVDETVPVGAVIGIIETE